MAVYSEPISEAELLEKLGDVKSVAIMGCPFCANMSLALFRDLPVFKMSSGGLEPVAMMQEISKIREFLEKRGIQVVKTLFDQPVYEIPMLQTPCMVGSGWVHDSLAREFKEFKDVDAVIALCCIGGYSSLVDVFKSSPFKGSPIKIVHGMRTLGSHTLPLKIEGEFIVLAKEKSRVFRWVPKSRSVEKTP